MGRRHNTMNVSAHIDEYVDVEVDIEDIIESLDEHSKPKLLQALGVATADCSGAGDAAFTRNTIMRAEMAARRMKDIPREIADLFWHVHGVAM